MFVVLAFGAHFNENSGRTIVCNFSTDESDNDPYC